MSDLARESTRRSRGITAEELRRHNLSAVLDRLHLRGPQSRSHLAAETQLNRSTIRDLISELADLGLVTEGEGTTSGSPGRPSTVASTRPQGAVVLAVELEVDSTAAATIGLGGHIFEKARIANEAGGTNPQQMIKGMARLVAPMLRSLPADHTLAGVGVAVAGVVHREDGYVHVAPNLGWSSLPLGDMISKELDVDRVMMANEADIGALAEYRRGAGRGARDMIFVAGEVGVGIGVIHDGKPMLGASGYAGEAGHTVINPAGSQCRCGSVGCWETEVGEEALARHTGIIGVEARKGLVEEVLRRAHAGDARTFQAFNEIGKWLGVGIGNLINTFNPDRIVIGGFFHQLFPFLEETIDQSAERTALAAPWEACSIVRSELGLDARLIGAAELVLSDVIANLTSFPAVAGASARGW
jgi:predicted NBD/HSP70 family sugar kinase